MGNRCHHEVRPKSLCALGGAYPRGLCDAVAHIVADRLFGVGGVVPVAHNFDGLQTSIVGPEYKSMFTIDVPASMQEPPSRHLVDATGCYSHYIFW